VQCEACKGKGRHQGSVFTYAHRQCHKCSGTGRKQRLGAQMLNHGKPRQETDRSQ
jgi:DnaJ-class molecular chaperone